MNKIASFWKKSVIKKILRGRAAQKFFGPTNPKIVPTALYLEHLLPL